MKLFVLISTIDRRVLRVPDMLCPKEKDVHFVVVWQKTQRNVEVDVSELEVRDDVTLITMEGRGLSRSRNRAMEAAIGLLSDSLEDAVFIIADDDEQFRSDAFGKVNSYYINNPKVDIALMRVRSNVTNRYFKHYPDKEINYHKRTRRYYPCSLEMTFRSRVWYAGLRFDTRFGLGSPKLCAGEEDVFLKDAVDKGLRIQIVPIDLGSTRPVTTGHLVNDKVVLRSRGAVYGYSMSFVHAFLRTLRESLSLSLRLRTRFFPIFRNIWYGVKYIRR